MAVSSHERGALRQWITLALASALHHLESLAPEPRQRPPSGGVEAFVSERGCAPVAPLLHRDVLAAPALGPCAAPRHYPDMEDVVADDDLQASLSKRVREREGGRERVAVLAP